MIPVTANAVNVLLQVCWGNYDTLLTLDWVVPHSPLGVQNGVTLTFSWDLSSSNTFSILQVCWGSYDTLTGHGLNVQKIKKGMLHYLDLEKGLCSKNSKILWEPK